MLLRFEAVTLPDGDPATENITTMAKKKPADDEDDIPAALKVLHKIWPPEPEPLGRRIGKALRGNKDAKKDFTDAAAEGLGRVRDTIDNAAEMGATIKKKYDARQAKKKPGV